MNDNYNRRKFLQRTSLWTAAIGTGVLDTSKLHTDHTLEAAENKDDSVTIPIVDTHQHLWDLKLLKLPWLKNEGVQSINRSYVMSDYLKATKGLNIVKTVYMEVNVHPSHQVREAEYVLDLCRRDDNPMAAAVIGGSPQSKQFKDYIQKFAGNKHIKGVRTVLHDPNRQRGMCLKPQFVENIKLLGELGMSYDLCMRPGEILDGVKLVDQCPKTRFVVDHCGNMNVQYTDKKLRATWMKGMKEIAQRDNVVCKISGIIVTAKKNWKPDDLAPNMNFCMETFGPDRAFFAGDWPVCTLRASFKQWVDALNSIVRAKPTAFKRKLFHDNAVKFYGLG